MSSKSKAKKTPPKKKQSEVKVTEVQTTPEKSTLSKAVKMLPAIVISAAAAYTVAIYDKEEKKPTPVSVTVEQPAEPEKLNILNPNAQPESEVSILAPDPVEEVKPPVTVPEDEKVDMTKVTKKVWRSNKKEPLSKLDDIETIHSSNGGLTRRGVFDNFKDGE